MLQYHQESESEQAHKVQLADDRLTVEKQPDEIESRIDDLTTAVRRRKRSVGRMWLPAAASVGSMGTAILLILNSVTGIRPVYWALFSIFVGSYGSLLALMFAGVNRLRKAMGALASTEDTRAVGVMAEALTAGELTASVAASALIRLLPRLTREQSLKLTDAQRDCLRAGLLSAASRRNPSRYNPALAIAILNAFERIGDDLDVEAVAQVASCKFVTTEQKPISEAAERCMLTISTWHLGNDRTHVPWLEAKLARTAPANLSTEAVDSLAERLQRIAKLRRRNVGLAGVGAVVGTGIAITSMLTSGAAHATNPVLLAGMLSSLSSIGYFAFRGTYALRNLTSALVNTDDLRIVAPLIQAAASVEVSGAAAAALLARLLPRLKASDVKLFDSECRTLLNTAIVKHSGNTAFVLAALQALQQIGDSSAIPTVRKLAGRSGYRGAEPAVRQAAIECLEFLELRAAEHEANHTLLRASSAESSPPAGLLRPVEAQVSEVSGELLRSSTASS